MHCIEKLINNCTFFTILDVLPLLCMSLFIAVENWVELFILWVRDWEFDFYTRPLLGDSLTPCHIASLVELVPTKKNLNSYQPLLLFELLLLIIFCSIRYHTLQRMVWNCRPRGEKRKELERVWEVRSVGVGSGRPSHTHMWHVGRESSQIYSCCSICCWHVSEKCFITYLPRSFPPDYYHILCSCKVAKIPSTFLLCVAAVLALDYNISLLYPYFCPFHLQIQ